MKKLVIITDNFLPRKDGISRFLSEIVPRLKSTYDITIICPDYGKITSYSYATIVQIPLGKHEMGDFQIAQFAPKILYKHIKTADIVFSQTIGPIGGLGLFIAQLLRKRTVSYIHSVEWELFTKVVEKKFMKKHAPQFTKKLVKFLYGNVKHIIVPSTRIAEMLTWQGVQTPKTIIHLGVDTTRFTKRDGTKIRDELDIQPTEIVIGYHGRIAKEKDISTLVRAFVKLRSQYDNLKLLLVGDGVSKLITKFKKQPAVVYVPAQDAVEYYLNAMDIYCLPSLTETTSLSTLEAMSSQLPIVTTQVGFVRDYIQEGITGFFFKTSDSYDLTLKLIPLIDDKELRRQMGEHAREFVVKRFDWDTTAKELIHFFAAYS